MLVVCIDNKPKPDKVSLTMGKIYKVKIHGPNRYEGIDDNGLKRPFWKSRFEIATFTHYVKRLAEK